MNQRIEALERAMARQFAIGIAHKAMLYALIQTHPKYDDAQVALAGIAEMLENSAPLSPEQKAVVATEVAAAAAVKPGAPASQLRTMLRSVDPD